MAVAMHAAPGRVDVAVVMPTTFDATVSTKHDFFAGMEPIESTASARRANIDNNIVAHGSPVTAVLGAEVWVNETATVRYPTTNNDLLWDETGIDERLLALQVAVEAELVQAAAEAAGAVPVATYTPGGTESGVRLSLAAEFQPAYSMQGMTDADRAAAAYGSLFVVAGVSMAALTQLFMVVSEKQARLLGALRALGVFDSAHWLSWFLVFLPVTLIGAVLAVLAAVLSDVWVFAHANAAVHVLALCGIAAAYSAASIILASITTRPVWVNMGALGMFGFAFALQFLILNFGLDVLVYEPTTAGAWRAVAFLLPGHHYASILRSIVTELTAQLVKNPSATPYFSWADMATRHNATTAAANPAAIDAVPSVSESVGYLVALCVIYLALAWYLGQVSTDGMGASQRAWFPLLPEYWGFKRTVRAAVDGEDVGTMARLQAESLQDGSVVVHKLSKMYDSTRALHELSMRLRVDECAAVLGQNGSGKTTLCNVLSGLVAPSHGNAFVCGVDSLTGGSEVQRNVGKMDQEELLWMDLSARQHMELFASLRGVPRADIASHVTEKLELVGLLDRDSVPVGTFSGGMQRRLSIVCTCVGHPRFILLDEPTTGLDPLSRRRVWALIRAIKPGRVMVLTTHDLEEAEQLGDQVAILVEGRVRADGTPTFLRSRFGTGFQLTATTSAEAAPALRKTIQDMIPGCEVVGDAAGNLTVAVPQSSAPLIPRLLRHLAANQVGDARTGAGAAPHSDAATHVDSWSVQLSGLEEVFLRLAGTSTAVNAPIGGISIVGAGGTIGGGSDTAPLNLCPLCLERAREPVTLFNVRGVEVALPDVICAACAKVEPGDPRPALADGVGREHAIDNPVAEASTASVGGTKGISHDGAPASRGTAPTGHGALPPATSFMSQVRAVFNMRLALSRRQSRTNMILVVLLVASIVIALVVGLFLPATGGLPGNNRCAGGWSAQSFPCTSGAMVKFMTSDAYGGADASANGRAARATNVTAAAQLPTIGLPLMCDLAIADVSAGGKSAVQAFVDRCVNAARDSVSANVTVAPQWWSLRSLQSKFDKRTPAPAFPNPLVQQMVIWLSGAPGVSEAALASLTLLTGESAAPAAGRADAVAACAAAGIGGVNCSTVREFAPFLAVADPPPSVAAALGVAGDMGAAITEGMRVLASGGDTVKNDLDKDGYLDACTDDKGEASDSEWQMPAERWLFADETAALAAARAHVPDVGVVVRGVATPATVSAANGASADGSSPHAEVAFDLHVISDGGGERYDNSQLVFRTVAGTPCGRVRFGKDSLTRSDRQDELPLSYDSGNTWSAAGAVSGMHSALLGAVLGPAPDGGARLVATRFRAMPMLDFTSGFVHDNVVHTFLLPLLTLMLLPRLVGALVGEKESGLLSLMRSQGLQSGSWWVGYYLFQVAFFLCVGGVYVVMGLLFGAFAQTGLVPLLALLLSWAHAQVGVIFLLAALVPRWRLAAAATYVVAIMSVIIGVFLNGAVNTLSGGEAAVRELAFPSGLLWFPPVAYVRAVYLVFTFSTNSVPPGSELADALLALLLVGTLALVVGAWLVEVLPGPQYAPRHPLFCLGARASGAGSSAWKRLQEACRIVPHGRRRSHPTAVSVADEPNPALTSVAAASGGGASAATASDSGLTVDGADAGVSAERLRVASADAAASSAVLMQNLCKDFRARGDHNVLHAVADLSLGVGYGTAFGLLGPNGAGKTTALSILQGALGATSGSVAIAGFDISTERHLVHRVLGVTPQFTTCWDDLSVRDTLAFFTALKGVPALDVPRVVQQLAERVRLDGDTFTQPAGQLSGGTRRRLAFAIALCGSPRVLLLDEPTTGLDPESRRVMWELIQHEKSTGRCIIVTTHSMTEAETLCGRIGIMARGRLRVLGSQAELKAVWGQGYTLSLALASSDEEARTRATAFMQEVVATAAAVRADDGASSGAGGAAAVDASTAAAGTATTVDGRGVQLLDEIVSSSAGTLVFRLHAGVDVASLFEALFRGARRAGIADWGINPASLDDVFVAVANAAEAEAARAEAAANARAMDGTDSADGAPRASHIAVSAPAAAVAP